jgi:hypothetical protein
MAISGYTPLEIKNLLHHKELSTTMLYINETAVAEARRQERNRLKLPMTTGDTTQPKEDDRGLGPLESATQVLHKTSSGPGRPEKGL